VNSEIQLKRDLEAVNAEKSQIIKNMEVPMDFLNKHGLNDHSEI
jgi:hypothetical protein